ncbi:MAG TPA: alkaline phosphatase family protein [Phycisphaerales bacterium]|nr:alkaline phosphatase family protein [Phycisphaerales bacterium]
MSLTALCLAVSAPAAASAKEPRADAGERTPKVLIIGIDGLRSDALLAANAPSLHALIRDGCFTDRSHTNAPTVSGPGWSSVLCGVWHSRHGVKDNTFRGADYARYPHMFTRFKEARPSLRVASWVTWEEIDKFITPTSTDIRAFHLYKDNGDEIIAARAAADLATRDIDVAFYYISDVDETGHNAGFHPAIPAYMEAIATADTYVGGVVDAVRSRPSIHGENWLVIVTTDHSGTLDGNHGRDEVAHRRIFHIVSGDSAARGTIHDTVNQVDVVTTAMAHMGITPDPRWNLDGRVRGLAITRRYGTNLVDNGDAEAVDPVTSQEVNLGIPGWTDLGGMTTISYDATGGFPAKDSPGPTDRGRAFFAGGAGDCVITQTIGLVDFAADIDAGIVVFELSAWLGGYADQRDLAELDVRFLDERDGTLGRAALEPVTVDQRVAAFGGTGDRATGFIERRVAGRIPPGTRVAEIRLQSLAGQGSADGYADNIALVLTSDD